jgi:pyroglutamyl-peptidase
MRSPAILLTSFRTWKPEQRSNSSDDLLIELQKQQDFQVELHVFRRIPVDFEKASQLAIAKIAELRPQAILCCGMAESRARLNVESQAIINDDVMQTSVNLEELTQDLKMTDISHNAGKFVCNQMYYDVLKYLKQQMLMIPCIFLHVPILTPEIVYTVISDTQTMIHRLAGAHRCMGPSKIYLPRLEVARSAGPVQLTR